jgi:tricorn protease
MDMKQETFHADFDVKNLASGGDIIVYEQGGALNTLDPATGQVRRLEIRVRGDFHWSRDRWEDVRPAALQNASLSPTGQRALFEYRGDIFTVPKGTRTVAEHHPQSGAADRFPVWSPDGSRIAWFSDQSGEYQLMVGDQEGMTGPGATPCRSRVSFSGRPGRPTENILPIPTPT